MEAELPVRNEARKTPVTLGSGSRMRPDLAEADMKVDDPHHSQHNEASFYRSVYTDPKTCRDTPTFFPAFLHYIPPVPYPLLKIPFPT